MPRIVSSILVAMSFVLPSAYAAGSTALPSPEELPANTVAVVSEVPLDLGRITQAELQRALVEVAAAAGRDSVPGPGDNGYRGLKDEAFGQRLDFIWIEGQAAMMGIDVSPRRVARELALIKNQSFESGAEYQRYLKEAHFTQRDVRERVRVQLLTTRIQNRVERRGGGGLAGFKAFKQFVDAYAERWRARTVCTPEYVTDRCSNGPPPG
ncbi:MAG TPA: SurA N-terminal domain-containing protein [Solirubrobacterales bacterium]|nr:SurA N-terminal domain-containing protein [Solirubrobacterales bacterium]